VKNGSGTVVRTLSTATPLEGAYFSPDYCLYPGQSVTWDGRNTAGTIVANGNYTIALHAQDANDDTADVVYATAVDARSPGALTQPAAGAVLSGNASFVYTPTAGFDLTSVDVGCLGSGTVQPNHTWTGTGDTTQCSVGTAPLSVTVGFTDQFGQSHSITRDGPSVVGPITRSVIERVLETAEQSRRPMTVLVGPSPALFEQFAELQRRVAPTYGLVTADPDGAIAWMSAER